MPLVEMVGILIMHGIDVANKVAHFELENAAALADLIKSEGIDCDLRPLPQALHL